MASIRIATFNIENLLQRFDFFRYGQLTAHPAIRLLGADDADDYFALRRAFTVLQTDDSRQQSAQAIREAAADVVCMQEVDHREILDDFNAQYLKKAAGVHYGWRRVVEGNDNRGIDVAVMAQQWIGVTSHAHHTFDEFDLWNQELDDYFNGTGPGDPVFRRDCLEVQVNVEENPLFLFICHFKSMSGGRDQTRPVRVAEASAVRAIIESKWADPAAANWLIVGDLNDYLVGNHALAPLFDGDFSTNLVERLPAEEQWTHYYAGENSKRQLDYILASPSVVAKNPTVVPDIIRGGQPYRVPGTDNVDHYPRIGFDRPKASDHCPVAVTLEI